MAQVHAELERLRGENRALRSVAHRLRDGWRVGGHGVMYWLSPDGTRVRASEAETKAFDSLPPLVLPPAKNPGNR